MKKVILFGMVICLFFSCGRPPLRYSIQTAPELTENDKKAIKKAEDSFNEKGNTSVEVVLFEGQKSLYFREMSEIPVYGLNQYRITGGALGALYQANYLLQVTKFLNHCHFAFSSCKDYHYCLAEYKGPKKNAIFLKTSIDRWNSVKNSSIWYRLLVEQLDLYNY